MPYMAEFIAEKTHASENVIKAPKSRVLVKTEVDELVLKHLDFGHNFCAYGIRIGLEVSHAPGKRLMVDPGV